MTTYPKVKAVKPLSDYQLLVTFQNHDEKIYHCLPLLDEYPFTPLKNSGFFKTVKVDMGGYGISWNDEIDLSESELWENGILLENFRKEEFT